MFVKLASKHDLLYQKLIFPTLNSLQHTRCMYYTRKTYICFSCFFTCDFAPKSADFVDLGLFGGVDLFADLSCTQICEISSIDTSLRRLKKLMFFEYYFVCGVVFPQESEIDADIEWHKLKFVQPAQPSLTIFDETAGIENLGY